VEPSKKQDGRVKSSTESKGQKDWGKGGAAEIAT
jgi:hypothetical protein